MNKQDKPCLDINEYRFLESLLNDFKNQRIGFTNFIDKVHSYYVDNEEKARQEEREKVIGEIEKEIQRITVPIESEAIYGTAESILVAIKGMVLSKLTELKSTLGE